MWNRLLSQIVEQSGGTVTNKDNRCKLLQDWLDIGEQTFQQELDTILFIGASITNQSNSDYVQDFTNEYVINKYGKPITLINEAVSGTDVADWRLLIDGVLDTYMATPNLGVYLHIGGGDIDPYANFLDYGEATRQQKIDDLTYIHQAAKDRGLVMVQAALTFRNYDGTTIRDTIAEQASSSKGSYSYTRDWIAPIMKEFTPQFLDSTDWPLIDMHGLTRNIYEEWREPASTDYVHPNKYGRAAYLTYAVDCMISIFGGINPTKIVQRDYTQAISLPTSPLDVVFGFGRSYYIGITDDNINWTSRDRPPAAGTEGVYISDCIDSSGAIVSGINMYSYIDATMRNGYGNTEDPTNSTASLYNNTLLLSGLSTSTGSGAMYVMIEGLESNKEYNIDAVAVASSGGTSDYTCDFEIPNGLNSVFTTDAANPIPEDNIITTVIKTDQMGRAILASVEQSTLNNSIISGIRIYA